MRRAGIIGAVVVAVVALSAMPAAAHVTVNPKEATVGSYARLTFRVPNEKDNASTIKLEVFLPETAPIPNVSIKPVTGWTATVEKGQITWTADGEAAAIKPGQFQEFDVSAGPLPEVSQIIFKALQTYSDGDVVRWIEEPRGDVKVEHPAPVLKVVPKPVASAAPVVATAGATSSAVSIALSGGALTIALITLGMVLRRRKS